MVSISAEYIRSATDEDGNKEITFRIKNPYAIAQLGSLPKKEYRLKIEECTNKRSLNQNSFMWSVINQIAKETHNDEWDVYMVALERAGAKYEYIACLPEAKDILEKQFRAIKLMNQFEHNGRTFNQYKVFYGSSKLNSKEMTELIETVLQIAAENGVVIDEG